RGREAQDTYNCCPFDAGFCGDIRHSRVINKVPFKKNLAAAEKANPLEACSGSTTMADHATQLETVEEFTEDPEESPLISGCVDRGRSGTEDCGNGKT
ncbi:unnamed protein product, partial [Pylaiella littoralis]